LLLRSSLGETGLTAPHCTFEPTTPAPTSAQWRYMHTDTQVSMTAGGHPASHRVVSRRVTRGLQWHRSTTPHGRQAQTHHQPESKLPGQEPLLDTLQQSCSHGPRRPRRRSPASSACIRVYNLASPDARGRAVVSLPSATHPPWHPAPPTLRHRLHPSTHVRPCLRERDSIPRPEHDGPSLPTGCCDVSGHSGLSLTFPPSSSFPFPISKLLFLGALLLS
jgi:hypothetical protein